MRATLLELCPEGFEEVDRGDALELAAYVDAGRAASICARFAGATSVPVTPGWEDAWRCHHRPVRVGPFWVGPPWEPAPADAVCVVIDPGRAFGTGAHPTTRLCLELLAEVEPGSVLDLGCGSGVLSVAAALSGFGPVTALDLEEAAVEATRANARANGVDVRAYRADVLAEPLPQADLALANLELRLVERLAARPLPPRLVASGLLAGEVPRLPGWRRVDRRELDGWAAERLAAEPADKLGSRSAWR